MVVDPMVVEYALAPAIPASSRHLGGSTTILISAGTSSLLVVPLVSQPSRRLVSGRPVRGWV
jgi:hypothetical protein